MNIADNASNSPQTVTLTGTGVTLTALLVPGSLGFGNQPLGVASTAQFVTLQNSGTATLTGIAVSTTGANGSDFSQTSTCGTTLAAGSTCTISVIFTPGAIGNRSGTLSVADSASNSPQTAALAGTGVAPFTLTAGVASASVRQGGTAMYTLAYAAAAGTTVNSPVSLSCSGMPSLSSCTFSPSAIASGTSSQSISLSVATTAPSASLTYPGFSRRDGAVLAFLFSLLWLLPRRFRVRALTLLFLLAVALGVTACGGKSTSSPSSGNPGTPAGTYTVVVTAASTAYSTTQSVALAVTQ